LGFSPLPSLIVEADVELIVVQHLQLGDELLLHAVTSDVDLFQLPQDAAADLLRGFLGR